MAKWGQMMLANQEAIGAVITAENGKPYGKVFKFLFTGLEPFELAH